MAKGGKGGSGFDQVLRGNRFNDILTGGSGADHLDGRDGDDLLSGLAGNDLVQGGEGSDTLSGGLGDDTLEGGLGADVAVFAGNRGDYTITQIDAVTVEVAGPDGVDLVSDVEVFRFDDVTQSFAEVLLPWLPDLSVTSVTASATALIEGDTLSVDWAVGSGGDADAGASVTQVVIATAPDMGAVVGSFGSTTTGALASGTSGAFSATFDTSGLAPGTYYVAAVADAGDALAESDEGNNVSGWTEIVVAPQVVDYYLSDVRVLASSDLNLNADASGVEGARIDASYTVVNDGNSGPVTFSVMTYLTTSPDLMAGETYDIGYDQITLGYGESVTGTVSFETGALFPAGDYYVVSVVVQDAPSQVMDLEDDNILATASPVTLVGGTTYGTEGDDLFVSTSYDERFEGGAGNDTMVGSVSSDVFLGGEGVDTADFSGYTYELSITDQSDPGAGLYALYVFESVTAYYGGTGQVPETWLDSVERVIGTAFGDSIYAGESQLTYIDAGAGDDIVVGSYADDTILGGAGDDQLAGIFGDDLLTTGDGFDVIFVDREDDGAGGYTGHGHDVVTDFDPLSDLLVVEYDTTDGTPYDPFLDLVMSAEGVVLHMADDSSILLQGVDIAEMTAMNLMAYEEDPYATVLM